MQECWKGSTPTTQRNSLNTAYPPVSGVSFQPRCIAMCLYSCSHFSFSHRRAEATILPLSGPSVTAITLGRPLLGVTSMAALSVYGSLARYWSRERDAYEASIVWNAKLVSSQQDNIHLGVDPCTLFGCSHHCCRCHILRAM